LGRRKELSKKNELFQLWLFVKNKRRRKKGKGKEKI